MDADLGYVAIGYSPGFVRYNPLLAVWRALLFTGEYVFTYIKALPMLFTKAGVQSLTGPIGIARMTGEAAMGGFMSLLWLTGIISVAIGLTQLFRFPHWMGDGCCSCWSRRLPGAVFRRSVREPSRVSG